MQDVDKNLDPQKGDFTAVAENNQLVGVSTSNDFVKLAIEQLDSSTA